MENSRKSTIYSIIPLIILIVIIAFTRNGAKKGELQEAEKVFRINNYQNYEPSVQWDTLTRSDGWYYIGEFSENEGSPKHQRHWYWTMYYPDGCVLTGDWINWIVEGKGTYDCNEGIYSWEFKNNMINGIGILMNNDGSYYSWEWLNEEPHWYGILHYNDWEVYEWYRSWGSKRWTWKYTAKDWSIFEGSFFKGMKNWNWKLSYPDWNSIEGVRINDELQENTL